MAQCKSIKELQNAFKKLISTPGVVKASISFYPRNLYLQPHFFLEIFRIPFNFSDCSGFIDIIENAQKYEIDYMEDSNCHERDRTTITVRFFRPEFSKEIFCYEVNLWTRWIKELTGLLNERFKRAREVNYLSFEIKYNM